MPEGFEVEVDMQTCLVGIQESSGWRCSHPRVLSKFGR